MGYNTRQEIYETYTSENKVVRVISGFPLKRIIMKTLNEKIGVDYITNTAIYGGTRYYSTYTGKSKHKGNCSLMVISPYYFNSLSDFYEVHKEDEYQNTFKYLLALLGERKNPETVKIVNSLFPYIFQHYVKCEVTDNHFYESEVNKYMYVFKTDNRNDYNTFMMAIKRYKAFQDKELEMEVCNY